MPNRREQKLTHHSKSAFLRLPTAKRPRPWGPVIMGKKGGKKKAKKTLTDEEKLLAAEQAVRSRCVLPPLPLLKLLP